MFQSTDVYICFVYITLHFTDSFWSVVGFSLSCLLVNILFVWLILCLSLYSGLFLGKFLPTAIPFAILQNDNQGDPGSTLGLVSSKKFLLPVFSLQNRILIGEKKFRTQQPNTIKIRIGRNGLEEEEDSAKFQLGDSNEFGRFNMVGILLAILAGGNIRRGALPPFPPHLAAGYSPWCSLWLHTYGSSIGNPPALPSK